MGFFDDTIDSELNPLGPGSSPPPGGMFADTIDDEDSEEIDPDELDRILRAQPVDPRNPPTVRDGQGNEIDVRIAQDDFETQAQQKRGFFGAFLNAAVREAIGLKESAGAVQRD